MAKYWKTKQFKQLQAQWYKKLADSGWQDIEHIKYQDTPYLRKHSMGCISSCVRAYYSQADTYYRLASGWIWHGTFDDDWDKWVWTQHAQGHSEREIVNMLDKPSAPFDSCSRFPINTAINRVKEQMFASSWYNNYQYDGYVSMYDTSMILYGDDDE